MRTRDDIFKEVLVRNNRTTTDGFITDTMLKNWYQESVLWAASFKKWPMTEGRVQTTFTATEEWNFEGYKANSFRIVTVGGKRLRKLNYDDYLIFKEKEPNSSERVYSDYGRTLFINSVADVSGTLIAYGQYQPLVDVTDETGTTIFTDYDDEGNEGILEKMSGFLKRREHQVQEAEMHDNRAALKLQEVWQRILDEQAGYQTHQDRGGMFGRIDILSGLQEDEVFKRDQF